MKSSKTLTNSNLKVSVYWGDILYDTAVFGPNSSVTVGRKPGNSFIVENGSRSHGDSFPLITIGKGEAGLAFDDQLDGHVRFGGEVFPLRKIKGTSHAVPRGDGLSEVKLTDKDKATVVMGHVSFSLDWVNQYTPLPRSKSVNKKNLAWFVLALLLPMTLLQLALRYVIGDRIEEKPPERIVTIERKYVPPPPPPPEPVKAAMGEKKTADGGAQKGEKGKAELKPPPTARPTPSQADKLRSSNLGNLVKGLSNLGASSAPSKAAAPANPLRGFTSPLAQTGTGGFSTEGLKKGGGGKSVGLGRTVGQGQGGFQGLGQLGLAGNSKLEGGTGIGVPQEDHGDGLDRDVIDNIVRRRQDRIRLCYERQLNFVPNLSGKIAIAFVIGKTGAVVEKHISEDTMRNEEIRKCVLAEVSGWTFPAPRGGGRVNVEYPFVFESGRGLASP